MIRTIKQGAIVVYDCEWTSWPGAQDSNWSLPWQHKEIIQIGAVKLDVGDGFREIDSFERFVRPERNPELSDYIIELTGITQNQIDQHGVSFPMALADFTRFLSDVEMVLSYGGDGNVIEQNCALTGIPKPSIFLKEHNVRRTLQELGFVTRTTVSSSLPAHLGLEHFEHPHNALGDARAVAASIRHLRKASHV